YGGQWRCRAGNAGTRILASGRGVRAGSVRLDRDTQGRNDMVRVIGLAIFAALMLVAHSPEAKAQSATPPYGIDVKRPLFGGACKVCPWGVLADVTRDALKPYG